MDSTINLKATSARATVHCLTGCVIGEVIGLAIGVHYGLGAVVTIILATVLAYIAGFTLATSSIIKKRRPNLPPSPARDLAGRADFHLCHGVRDERR